MIEEFLTSYSKKSTKGVYRSGVYAFLDFYFKHRRKNQRENTLEDQKWYEDAAQRYFSEAHDYGDDLEKFAISMEQRPPYTARSYMNAFKELLSYNKIDLSHRDNKKIKARLPKGKTRTVERD